MICLILPCVRMDICLDLHKTLQTYNQQFGNTLHSLICETDGVGLCLCLCVAFGGQQSFFKTSQTQLYPVESVVNYTALKQTSCQISKVFIYSQHEQ